MRDTKVSPLTVLIFIVGMNRCVHPKIQKNYKKAIFSLTDIIKSGESVSHVFYIIIRQFRLILQIKDYIERQQKTAKEIASIAKIHPFVVQNIAKQVHNFSFKELQEAYKHLLKIDFDMKTGKIDVHSNNQDMFIQQIETFIIQCCL